MKKIFWPLLILFILALPLIYPFFTPGYFATHDGEWAIVRLAEMHREVKDMQLPPRWSHYLNHGFGYPLFLFTYPFPYYAGEFLHLIGIGFTDTIKLIFILSIVLSSITMYLLGNKYWGTWGGFISAVLFTFAPYRITNLFIRGSLGESLATIYFPLLFYLLSELVVRPSRTIVTLTVFSLATFILTHNATVVLFLPVLLVWVILLLFQGKKISAKNIKIVSIAFILSLTLSAFFWLPALTEKKFVALSVTPLTDKTAHFLSMFELASTNTSNIFSDKPHLAIGLLQLVMIVAALLSLYTLLKLQKRKVFTSLAIFIIGFVSLGMVLPVSVYFWKLPLLKDIDFPWRMLSVSSFLLAFGSGIVGQLKWGKWISLLVTIFALVSFVLPPLTHINKGNDYYATNDATTTSADELMPIWVSIKPTNRSEDAYLLSSGAMQTLEKTSTIQNYEVAVSQSTEMMVNTVFFPGWRASIDSYPTQIKITPVGLMSLSIPPGEHQIRLQFTNTPIRLIGNILSIGSLFVIVILWKFSKK